MPIDCQRSTSGGKGNLGMFIERDPQICAAGIPSAQPDHKVSNSLQHYLLKDEVDCLVSDAIIPPKPPRPLPPLRHPIPLDKRNGGLFSDMAALINSPILTKFQTLVEDFKCTPYTSYWQKPLGGVRDPVPMLPEGFDIKGTTFGKKTPFHGTLYETVMPTKPMPENTSRKLEGEQINRNYCKPDFNPELTFGHRTGLDKRGTYAKCCLTDDRVKIGTGGRVVINSVLANYQDFTQPRIGAVLAPYDNIKEVPHGYAFGKLKPPDNLPECLTTCELNPGMTDFRKCFKHLNSLRKCLSTRYLPTFFYNFYLSLKFFDKSKTGWLPKQIVYDFCGTKFIRFDPSLIEPLLSMWQAFDGNCIEYKTFVRVINYREPSPEIPKIPDIPDECIDFRTTYTEMVKPNQPPDNSRMAGLPSGRYFDMDYPITPEGYTRAHRTCLPHESDMKSCLNPSVLTLLHVSHRDMYAKREPDVVRRVFEKSGEKFTDERFETVWEEAKKSHSEGWVCYETFRRALMKLSNEKDEN